MDKLEESIQPVSQSGHHRIWTRKGERRFAPGQSPVISESERTSDDSSIDGFERSGDSSSFMRGAQDSYFSEAGDLSRIMGVVSSYWESRGKEADDSSRGNEMGSLKSPPSDKVGYLDPHKSFSSLFSPPSGPNMEPVQPKPPVREPVEPPKDVFPHEVRMITHSDAVPRVIPPPEPLSTLPTLTQSPLALLTAASGGNLDLNWLESFDNSTLETLVPRDPRTGRPLTLGSIDHAEGKCRPCIFFLKAKCFKGLRCSFCHFNHATLRKQVPSVTSGSSLDLNNLVSMNAEGAQAQPTMKSKRLRPSKRTREMIKQINEQMMFEDMQEDPHGPPLSVNQTGPATKLETFIE